MIESRIISVLLQKFIISSTSSCSEESTHNFSNGKFYNSKISREIENFKIDMLSVRDFTVTSKTKIYIILSEQTANNCCVLKYLKYLKSQRFISRMPKMCAIPQLVSAPLNPIPIVEHFRRSHPLSEHSY